MTCPSDAWVDPSRPDRLACGALVKDENYMFMCTRLPGHDGEHHAHDHDAKCCAVWTDDDVGGLELAQYFSGMRGWRDPRFIAVLVMMFLALSALVLGAWAHGYSTGVHAQLALEQENDIYDRGWNTGPASINISYPGLNVSGQARGST